MSGNRTRWLAVGVTALFAIAATALPAHASGSPGVVEGHLTDDGAPVNDASVSLFDAGYNFVASTATDGSGGYRLSDVPAGTYKLQFVLDNGFEQWAVQKATFETADLITVNEGNTTTVEESVRPHGGMTGHVYNVDGSPAANAVVSAVKDDDHQGYSGHTDDNGRYLFPYLPPGNYRVSFQRDNSPQQYANNSGSYDDATLIPVTAGEVMVLDQTFVALGAITGRVTDDGAPVEGVYVGANASGGLGNGSMTGPDGTYRVPLWPGSYKVTFQLPDGRTQYAPRQVNPAKAELYTVLAGADTLLHEKIRSTGTVSGQLIDSTGTPVPYAMVELTGKWNTLVGSADENGRYELKAFPGPYQLAFRTEQGTQWSNGRSTADTADLISLEADTNLVINETLAEPGTLVVAAENRASHEPVAEFCVGLDVAYQCTSTGSVTIEGLLPGRYTVRHSRKENEPFAGTDRITATVTSGQTSTAMLPLTSAASVTTLITDAKTGIPVAHACLEMIDVTAPMLFGINTGNCSDENGNVTVPFLPPGSYKPFVWVRDGVHGMQWVGPDGGVGKFIEARTVTLTAGQFFALPAVRLDEAGTITGTVTDEATGEPIRDATVGLSTYYAGEGGGGGLVSTDSAGRYTRPGLGPYGWTLYFSDREHASEWSGDSTDRNSAAGIMVKAGGTTTYDAALGWGTEVTGRVFGPDGSMATDARISVINAESGDEIGVGDMSSSIIRYSVRVNGPQRIKLQYFGRVLSQYYDGWAGGDDFATAMAFSVPASGTEKIDVTMTHTSP